MTLKMEVDVKEETREFQLQRDSKVKKMIKSMASMVPLTIDSS